ncbi:hypothetical protein THAOC_20946, partial [Thalassiosira oceanica]
RIPPPASSCAAMESSVSAFFCASRYRTGRRSPTRPSWRSGRELGRRLEVLEVPLSRTLGIMPPPPTVGPTHVVLAVRVVSYASSMLLGRDPSNSILGSRPAPSPFCKLLVKSRVPTAGRLGAPTVAGGRASPSIASHNHPPSPAASYSERMHPSTADALAMQPRCPHAQHTLQPRLVSNVSTPQTTGAPPAAVYCRIRPPPTPGCTPTRSCVALSRRQAEPDRGGNHPPEAPGIAIRPSIALPPTPSLLDQRDL